MRMRTFIVLGLLGMFYNAVDQVVKLPARRPLVGITRTSTELGALDLLVI